MIVRRTRNSLLHALKAPFRRPPLSRDTSTSSSPSTSSFTPLVPPPAPPGSLARPEPAIDWSTISSHPGITRPIIPPTTATNVQRENAERTAINRSTRRHLNLIPLSPAEQFKHNLFSLIRSTLMSGEFDFTKPKEVRLGLSYRSTPLSDICRALLKPYSEPMLIQTSPGPSTSWPKEDRTVLVPLHYHDKDEMDRARASRGCIDRIQRSEHGVLCASPSFSEISELDLRPTLFRLLIYY
jgi:hypothetical protein